MKCTNNSCGKELPDDAKFCDKCGTSAQANINCRSCGELNLASAAFCKKCGKSQAEPVGDAGVMAELPNTGEFVYLADDKKMQMEAKKKTHVNAGVVAFTVTHGKVRNISALNKNKSGESDFFGAVAKVVTGFLGVLKSAFSDGTAEEAAAGKLSKSSQVYVMLNLKGSPLLSHVRQIPIPGLPDANLRFEFWVDTENEKSFELFMQRCVGTRAALSCHELKEIAINAVESILPALALPSLQSDPASAAGIALQLEQMTGISASCIFRPGKLGNRHQLDISRTLKYCPNKNSKGEDCKALITKPTKYCGKCGGDCTGIDWKADASFLQASGGEQLTLRLSMLANQTAGEVGVNIDNAKVVEEVIKYLGPELRRYDVPSLMRSSMLIQLSNYLNDKLLRDWRGYVTEFCVVDLRTTEQDWFFNTEALLAEQLRLVAEDKKNLAIEESELDLKESAFQVMMRRIGQQDSEELTRRRLELEKKAKAAELELAEHELQVKTALSKDGITDEAAKQKLAREKEEMLRNRDFLREETKGEREDEVSQISHEITLEKTAAQHDIDLGDMAGEAKSRASRRDTSDKSFVEDEAIRLAAKREEQLGNIKEDLEDRQGKRQIDKLRAMAEMEAAISAQDNAHELNKTKEENALARDKIDAMKNMSAAEMLALQAVDLAAKGASADMVKGITDASSGVKVAEAKEAAAKELLAMQEKMFERMLAQQNQSSDREAAAHKLAVNVAVEANVKSMDSMMQVAKVSAGESSKSYKDAAEMSRSVNEKSMDSMAKVATAAAAHSTDGFNQAAEISRSVNEKSMESMAKVYSTAISGAYVCQGCKKEVPETSNFCTGCGAPKVKD
jgi:hypothetical protein